jgi:hypothetical protein
MVEQGDFIVAEADVSAGEVIEKNTTASFCSFDFGRGLIEEIAGVGEGLAVIGDALIVGIQSLGAGGGHLFHLSGGGSADDGMVVDEMGGIERFGDGGGIEADGFAGHFDGGLVE